MSSAGEFTENDVEGYNVYIVNNKGRILEKVAYVEKVASTTQCCTATLYSTSISVKLPTGYDKFMIAPYSGVYVLPMGFLTETISDDTAGLAEKVTGSFTLEVSDIEAAKKSPKFRDACRIGLANSISGVTKDQVRITDIKAATGATRRLRLDGLTARLSEAARRLASHATGGSVIVEYEIILPESYSGPPIGASTITAATLKDKINKAVVDSGAGITVTKVKDITAPTTTSVGTPGSSGGARRNAPLGLFATLVAMAAALRMWGIKLD